MPGDRLRPNACILRSKLSHYAASAGAAIAMLLLAGCASRREQLECVAKDWCETIRASQVIPVYPLTEDLRPGDVFLVQVPIADEASRYRQKGFLPLDDYRTRLNLPGAAYSREYFDGYWKDVFWANGSNPRPTRTPGAFPPPAAPGAPAKETVLSNANAPRAAFPSYTFDVSNSGGLSLAVPIQGVPLALGVLQADRATGSMTIADARTYAANPEVVYNHTKLWSEQPEIRSQLRWAARTANAPVYVRVVTRVYYAGAMNVTLTNKDAFGTEFAGGKAPKIDLVDETGTVNVNNRKILNVLNTEPPTTPAEKSPESTLPAPNPTTSNPSTPPSTNPPPSAPGTPSSGAPTPTPPASSTPGSTVPTVAPPAVSATGLADKSKFDWANVGARFKFQSISSRSVTMAEMFDTPLVIGYLGFDAPVYLNGEIGPPLPTFLRLEGVLSSPNELRAAENRYLQQTLLIDNLLRCPPADSASQQRWATVIRQVSSQMNSASAKNAAKFSQLVLDDIKTDPRSNGSSVRQSNLEQAVREFRAAVDDYVGTDADAEYPVRTNRLTDLFDIAFESTRVAASK